MTRDEITDEMLMAYADGELDAATRARVEGALVEDTALAARLKVFTATRAALGALGRHDAASIGMPPGLQAALRAKIEGAAAAGAAPAPATPADRVVPFQPRPARSVPLWTGALAASLALAVGLGGGLLLGSGSGSGGAGGPQGAALRAALDSVASGDTQSLADGSTLTVIATFVSAQGAICREYEVARPAGVHSVEVACDDGTGWEPQLMVALGGAEGYAPASAPDLLELYFEQSDAGAPLDPAAERAALAARGD